jgi:hypothetical protein
VRRRPLSTEPLDGHMSDAPVILTAIVWWYLILLILSIASGVVDDRLAGNPPWQLAADVACGIGLVIFVLAWWSSTVNRVVGVVLPILVLLAFAWEVFALLRDYRQITSSMEARDPTRLWVRLRIAMYWATITPAYVCGAIGAAEFYGAI